MPREIVRIDFEGVFTREDNPNQVREYNYVFSYDAIDTETGVTIASNEYRTVASDVRLNLDDARDRISNLVETGGT